MKSDSTAANPCTRIWTSKQPDNEAIVKLAKDRYGRVDAIFSTPA